MSDIELPTVREPVVEAEPPIVNNPVPVIIGRLLAVFKESVPSASKRYAPEIVSCEPVEVAVPPIATDVPKYPLRHLKGVVISPMSKRLSAVGIKEPANLEFM